MSTLQTTALLLLLAVLWKTVPDYFVNSPTPVYGGFVHPDFQEVRDIFGKNIESGREPGGSFAVYHNGEVLVDLWGGQADPEAHRPWKQDTMSQAWSSTKGVAAITMAMLVDRNLLDYDEYVHKYWPEFKQNGKDNVTVAMLLSHQAGLIALDRQISLLEYRDNWDEVEQLMAQQKPFWPPGTMSSYHAFTFGMFVDALVRKVDPKHRNISQFFKDEIAEPFGIDFYVGLPLELHFRAARASYVPVWKVLLEAVLAKPYRWKYLPELLPGRTIHSSVHAVDFAKDFSVMNNPDLQSIGLSSAIGFGTARSLAKLYDYLANKGSIKGKRLLSSLQIAALSTPVKEDIPRIGPPEHPIAMGTCIDLNLEGQPIFGHRGYGGQNAFADPQYGIGVSYITNFNSIYSDSDDPRAHDLLVILYKCLQKYNHQHNKV